MKASLQLQPMYCFRDYNYSSRFNQQYEKPTQNLIELDIPTEGPPIASKPYTVPLEYHEFVDHKIKQLEETGIISRSMSNWASPILTVSMKEE